MAKDIDLLEKNQHGAIFYTKVVSDISSLSCTDYLRYLGLYYGIAKDKRRLLEDFKIINNLSNAKLSFPVLNYASLEPEDIATKRIL